MPHSLVNARLARDYGAVKYRKNNADKSDRGMGRCGLERFYLLGLLTKIMTAGGLIGRLRVILAMDFGLRDMLGKVFRDGFGV